MLINEDFVPKREKNSRLPPGQYETRDFPVLSLGPEPDINTDRWRLEIKGLVLRPKTINFSELKNYKNEKVKHDIHCVTKWSKFDTNWRGVLLSEIMEDVEVFDTATHLIAHSSDGYTTNIPIEDLKDGKALVVYEYEDEEIPIAHGGPVRLFIPHLYFWKSAKWLSGLEFIDHDEPGFWEVRGYHNYGDPWREERYSND